MIKTLGASLVILFFVACKNLTKTEFNSADLMGEWVTDYFKDNGKEKILSFSFRDSSCTYMYPYGAYTPYSIDKDTLTILERIITRKGGKKYGGKEIYKFKIVESDAKNLSLLPISEQTKNLFKYLESFPSDTIMLRKLQQKNNEKIDQIAFYSSGCYGPCPSMYLEIDSVGNILFDGYHYTEMDGQHSGTIPQKVWEEIRRSISLISLDSLKEKYTASWTDDQTCGVSIKTDRRTIISMAYGFHKEPIELRLLFHKLLEVYKSAEMIKDTMLEEQFFFEEFPYHGYEPPPPRPPGKK
jgi:hypothetical protein